MKYYAAISIDLNKAFDSISHDLLIINLEKCGLGVALRLLISFPNNRNQCVTFNNSKFQIKNIKFVSSRICSRSLIIFNIYK